MFDLETQVDNKFEEIRNFIMGKPYAQHIVTPFLAVENNLTEEDYQVCHTQFCLMCKTLVISPCFHKTRLNEVDISYLPLGNPIDYNIVQIL